MKFLCPYISVLGRVLGARTNFFSSMIPPHVFRLSFHDVVRMLVISSYGKLCAVAAMVWTGDFYLWLPTLFVFPAQLQAFRGDWFIVLLVGIPER